MLVVFLRKFKEVLEKLIALALILNEKKYNKVGKQETQASLDLVGKCNAADARCARVVQNATKAAQTAKTQAAEHYTKVSVRLDNKINKLNSQRAELEDL